MEEASASAGRPGVIVAGSPLEEELSETAPEHGVLLSQPSSLAAKRRPELRENNPSPLAAVVTHYRWHQCAVVNIFLDEVLGLESPPQIG